MESKIEQFREAFYRIKTEIGKVIVGQEEVIEGVLLCLFADGHVLLEGVPGLGKTQLVMTLSRTLGLSFKRIQFTPDLMPSDITGTNVIVEDSEGRRSFKFQPGPIFAQIILADEINRATPRTQSALLEAMQEHTVSVSRETYPLEEPFFVLATQNPIEMEGTYRLPEAQLDRFMFKLKMDFPGEAEMVEILRRTTSINVTEVTKVLDAQAILEMRKLVRQVPIASHVENYIIRLICATHPEKDIAPELTRKYVQLGASIRGLQAITLTAKIRALLDGFDTPSATQPKGRYNVAFEDVQKVTHPALRHRILRNIEGEAEGIDTDKIIDHILSEVKPNATM
ncbi:MoxR family ATPase [Candidatus Poribacteria bacterium]|nr:MoxR family ATPase [Candidatus Poribacteria bacterium]